MSGLSHLDADGRARMVDVGAKPVTAREAVASGRLLTTPEVIALVRADGLPKADVLATARLAGIGGAKRTSELIPLCHPLPLDSVSVDFELDDSGIRITATARVTARTGVEMEALTAVAVAGLTLHDMIKAVDPAATLTEVRLESKSGGRHGEWMRGAAVGRGEPSTGGGHAAVSVDAAATDVAQIRTAVVIVASTRAAAGEADDRTGPLLVDWLRSRGFDVAPPRVVADAEVAAAVDAALAARPRVLITTGGTGLGPGDQTPDVVRSRLRRELPGVIEAVRGRGLASTPTAALSRGVAGVSEAGTVVVTLPGSTGGVRDGIAVLDGLLDHLLQQLAGHADHG
ncbi:bifunctional molybdenum cofactor biosynthesis protein MoaC/MoaB [Schumannella sp. 10F1B-5-1]|uniref:bifunctional molybdenum cofactor biosynthesis protein MoaC/MoaB n=1 Tax=Schumannella sp. 10F1B-5-1 TaxID=2590780 RepID=UPI0011322D3E|nr:bifunctional molybdenum cofactor biosynthesis protein MoaC/MoaB [Schumannella sp. 10F1B-5-1]TPW72816.1 bifunctional molybdenum cofactor biosynthesis protein MoaC/MoaB [Schumannella sp. 10F1B-5-1]